MMNIIESFQLQFDQSSGKRTDMTDQWLGYCAFHLGDYKRALQVYQTLSQSSEPPEDVYVNLACCYFFLGMYPQSEKVLYLIYFEHILLC